MTLLGIGALALAGTRADATDVITLYDGTVIKCDIVQRDAPSGALRVQTADGKYRTITREELKLDADGKPMINHVDDEVVYKGKPIEDKWIPPPPAAANLPSVPRKAKTTFESIKTSYTGKMPEALLRSFEPDGKNVMAALMAYCAADKLPPKGATPLDYSKDIDTAMAAGEYSSAILLLRRMILDVKRFGSSGGLRDYNSTIARLDYQQAWAMFNMSQELLEQSTTTGLGDIVSAGNSCLNELATLIGKDLDYKDNSKIHRNANSLRSLFGLQLTLIPPPPAKKAPPKGGMPDGFR